nr:MAG TPA: hypothetical protein [Caudoviricetes sp.]
MSMLPLLSFFICVSSRIYKSHIFRAPLACALLPHKGIIVEPIPIRDVDAKHPFTFT